MIEASLPLGGDGGRAITTSGSTDRTSAVTLQWTDGHASLAGASARRLRRLLAAPHVGVYREKRPDDRDERTGTRGRHYLGSPESLWARSSCFIDDPSV